MVWTWTVEKELPGRRTRRRSRRRCVDVVKEDMEQELQRRQKKKRSALHRKQSLREVCV